MNSPLRVLIVDDDEVDRRAVRRLLQQTRFRAEIDEAPDRDAAAESLRNHSYDCILLDYNLPAVDGVALLREWRAAGIGTPVVALTGHGDEEIAVELMKAGAGDYLNKSTLTRERLERSLRYVLVLYKAEEERRMILAREQQARLEAQAANRAKDEFLATLSHELRTPLNAILGWTRLLSLGHLDEAMMKRAIELIDRNTRLQAQLIDDLLDVSRIVAGKLHIEKRTVLLRAILESTVESARPLAETRRIRLIADFERCDAAVDGDAARLQQVIWNLISNAIKFSPEGAAVTVSAWREPETVVIAVRDEGKGIAAEFLPHVFERFRQQDSAASRTQGGLGLGLSIVQHLVELHGGCVQAESDGEGCGATFTVTLPAAAAPAAGERAQPQAVPG